MYAVFATRAHVFIHVVRTIIASLQVRVVISTLHLLLMIGIKLLVWGVVARRVLEDAKLLILYLSLRLERTLLRAIVLCLVYSFCILNWRQERQFGLECLI